MKNNPTPQVALITGAARRIGAAIARMLHAAGMNIILHYHTSETDAENLCAELNAARANSAITKKADLLVFSNLQTLIEEAVKPWGRLDVLVNNASQFYKTHVGEVTDSAWEELINSNLKAPFFLSQAAAPFLAKHQGCIVNIADIHAETPMRDYAAYSIAKAGLVMATKVFAKELGPDVRVNAVSPGAIAWPEGKNSLAENIKQKIISETALHQHGAPEDIAKAVLFFVRDADYVTGQVLAVDGGRSI